MGLFVIIALDILTGDIFSCPKINIFKGV